MVRKPAPPVAVVISFIDCINRGDLDGLTALMNEQHTLCVLDEEPLQGREANASAWRGYFSAFPEYVIYPKHIAVEGEQVSVVGSTTGSHLGLPDDEEAKLSMIWTGIVHAGLLMEWRIREDTVDARAQLGLPVGDRP